MKLHDVFIEKMLQKVEAKMTTEMNNNDRMLKEITINNDNDYREFVDKFDLDVFGFTEPGN